MPSNTRILRRSFAGGEMSPEMFGRPDDVRFQAGASKIQNMICNPAGPVERRPGTQFVSKAKDSTKKGRVFPFKYSQDDTYVIEMSRSTVDAREIGYMRFHTNGGTLLYTKPSDFVGSTAVTTISNSTERFTATAHGLSTGDPIALTCYGSVDLGATPASSTNDRINYTNADLITEDGAPVVFRADGGTLPGGIEAERIYYVLNVSSVGFQVSLTKNGNTPITLTTNGTATVRVAIMPSFSGASFIQPSEVVYAIRVDANDFQVARSKDEALAATAMDVSTIGAGDVRVHYAYMPGDLSYDATTSNRTFSCMKAVAGDPFDRYMFQDDHLGHATSDTNFWYSLPGTRASVTFDTANDEVDWTSHGLENGDPVVFDGTTPPSGVAFGTTYFVRNKSTNAFQLATTQLGTVVDIGAGAASVSATGNPYFEVPHYYTEDELFSLTYAQSNDVLSFASQKHALSELRRLSATQWTFEEVQINSKILPPDDLSKVTTFGGEGMGTVLTQSTDRITCDEEHGLSVGESVHVTGLSSFGVADGYYICNTGTSGVLVFLRDTDTGAPVTTVTPGAPSGRIRSSPSSVETSQSYVVTSIDEDGEESVVSDEITFTNNLAVEGSYNTFSWSPVTNADRYRVYKKQTGLYGFVGDTFEATFTDRNIGPDLSATPPLADNAIRRRELVTFDTTNNRVQWANHGIPNGAPIVFDTNKTLPTGIAIGTPYFVFNAGEDAFQVTATPSGTTAVSLSGTPAGRHWGVTGAFPGAVAYFEQRRVMTGSLQFPQDIWMTATGTESDLTYSIPTVDSDRVHFRVASRIANGVRHVVPLSQLVLLSESAEIRVSPINDDALTPTSVSVRPQSFVGAASVQPEIVNSTVVFCAARGGHVRELGFDRDVAGYLTGDLSLRAAHLFDGLTIVQQSYAKAPAPILWFVSSAGNLLGLTYVPEEQVGAWHKHTLGGVVESVATVAEGTEDHTYMIVQRTINSVTTRFIERMAPLEFSTLADSYFVDCGLTYSGAAITVVTGLDHLEGETVNVLADGVAVTATVASGQITLTTAAAKIHIGIPITAELETLPVTVGMDAGGYGREKSITNAWVRVHETSGFSVGTRSTDLKTARTTVTQLNNGVVQVIVPPRWDGEGQILIQQSKPLPLTVLGVALEVTVGG